MSSRDKLIKQINFLLKKRNLSDDTRALIKLVYDYDNYCTDYIAELEMDIAQFNYHAETLKAKSSNLLAFKRKCRYLGIDELAVECLDENKLLFNYFEGKSNKELYITETKTIKDLCAKK